MTRGGGGGSERNEQETQRGGAMPARASGLHARIDVAHLPGVLDPQGATVERALPALGYHNVGAVSIAKTIRLVIDAPSADAGT